MDPEGRGEAAAAAAEEEERINRGQSDKNGSPGRAVPGSINQPVPGNYCAPPPRYYIYYRQGALQSRGDLIMAGLRYFEAARRSPLTSHSSTATYATRTSI